MSQARDPREIVSVNLDHVGGLIWGADSKLYLVRAEWSGSAYARGHATSMLMRFDPANNEWESLGPLSSKHGKNHYVSRGALSARGNMIFGKVARPSGG